MRSIFFSLWKDFFPLSAGSSLVHMMQALAFSCNPHLIEQYFPPTFITRMKPVDHIRAFWSRSPAPRTLLFLFSSLVGGVVARVILKHFRSLALPASLRCLLRGNRGGERLPPEVAERIIAHMNKDHGAQLVLYSKHYAGLASTIAATLTYIDSTGVELSVTLSSSNAPRRIYIAFPHGSLPSVHDARPVLVAMAETAAQALGSEVKAGESDENKSDPLTDTEHGFARAEMGSKKCLAGTVKKYDTHMFVLWKRAQEWPKHVEAGAAGIDPPTLPQALHAALKDCAGSISCGKVKLNVAECRDGSEDKDGTLLLFPQELCVTGVTEANAKAVVEALFAGEMEEGEEGRWGNRTRVAAEKVGRLKGLAVKSLPGQHLFVCCHGNRDKRCGSVGPYLVTELRRLIKEREEGAGGGVGPWDCPVRACSHVGGHAYAGNVISFCRRGEEGRVLGDWWGYVTPAVARELVERHLGKGELLASVWRGQMGLGEEEQRGVVESRGCQGCACGKAGRP